MQIRMVIGRCPELFTRIGRCPDFVADNCSLLRGPSRQVPNAICGTLLPSPPPRFPLPPSYWTVFSFASCLSYCSVTPSAMENHGGPPPVPSGGEPGHQNCGPPPVPSGWDFGLPQKVVQSVTSMEALRPPPELHKKCAFQ